MSTCFLAGKFSLTADVLSAPLACWLLLLVGWFGLFKRLVGGALLEIYQ